MGEGELKEKDFTPSTVLECENIAYQNDQGVVFSDLSMKIATGESYVILSSPRQRARSFLRICSTLSPPTSGRITWLGGDPQKDRKHRIEDIRRQIGYVHRRTTLVSNMTLVDNLTLAVSYHHDYTPDKAYNRIRGLLERLDLIEYRNMRPVELSYPRQRLAVYARELIKSPRLYILDSPMLDLDVHFTQVMGEIDRQRRQGKTALMMSDLPDRVIKKWSDDVLLIQEQGALRLSSEQFDPGVHFMASTGVWGND